MTIKVGERVRMPDSYENISQAGTWDISAKDSNEIDRKEWVKIDDKGKLEIWPDQPGTFTITTTIRYVENGVAISTTTYIVEITALGGIVEMDKTSLVKKGETVTLTVTPNEGYTVKTVTVVGTDDSTKAVDVTTVDGTTYTFVMPDYCICISDSIQLCPYFDRC
ncbi:MAG: hypothetical protein A3204_01970 [Candidatus Methanarcanum hacksteinii]|nr:MAG: hypothetical protein A3204_01970 [Candidatus Methanarcanum hacksteinii]